MMPPRRLPLVRLNPDQWLNLAFAALATVYVGFTAASLLGLGLFANVGWDFRGFWASAEIARSVGFAEVYSLDIQEQFQRPLYDAYAQSAARFAYATNPTPFLAIFVLPFELLLPFGPVGGFLIFTVLNAGIQVAYLWRFSRALGGYGDRRLFLAVMLSLPVFANLLYGQVNLWLTICLGEFLLAAVRGQGMRGGLWLGGLLLKPQTLVLLLPGLLLGRQWKTLAGFAASGLVLVAASVLLTGIPGMLGYLQILTGYAGRLPINYPEHMTNWRALAVNLTLLVSPEIAWGLASVGLVLTLGLALSLWLRPVAWSSSQFVLVLLGTYAATLAVTWHAHLHMAMPMIVPLVWLAAKGRVSRRMLVGWLVAPGLLYILIMLLGIGMLLDILPLIPDRGQRLVGCGMLILNVAVTIWAARQLGRREAAA